LIKLGHRRIAYIDKQPLDLPHKSARLKGFYKALELGSVEADRRLYVEGGVSFEDGARAMQFLLKRDPMPTAVLSFDDVVAMGALRSIKDNGLRVPEDISVIGFDDMPLCSYTVPRLTTTHYPISEMAEMACKLLLNRIEGSETDQKNAVVLPVRLVLRESTSECENN
jgi:DNA-binding LacI/PurR family transcriptional regulator